MKKEEKILNSAASNHISSGETSCLKEEYEKWTKLYTEDYTKDAKNRMDDSLIDYQEELHIVFSLIDSQHHNTVKRFLREEWDGPNCLSKFKEIKL